MMSPRATTYHKPLEELAGALQVHLGDLQEISHHALLRGGHVLVELLRPVVELLLTADVLAGDGKQFDWWEAHTHTHTLQRDC